jgi:hypothetical protein
MGERTSAASQVKSRWRDEEAAPLAGLDRLVYRSNKLGEDLTLTNTGGGNTSSKLIEKDPLTGAEVRRAVAPQRRTVLEGIRDRLVKRSTER